MRYQDIYPEPPLQDSEHLPIPTARSLLNLEFFEAEPGTMPEAVFEQHHILLNLREKPTRVENRRDGELRDFTYHYGEIIVTPAGIRSGWRWYDRSKVIVITLDPERLASFAGAELGMVLTREQLKSVPQFTDPDLCQVAEMLLGALQARLGSAVLFESLARVFLTKLLDRYGLNWGDEAVFSANFTPAHFQRVLDHVATHYAGDISLESLAGEAGLSPSHFSRLFKRTLGKSPHQFVLSYRVEQAKRRLAEPGIALIDVALACGFADQAHFSRVFKQFTARTPNQYRAEIDKK